MGSTRPSFRRALVALCTSALAASLLVVPAVSAQADQANPTPVSSTALPTAQVDGVVWAQAVVNSVDYVGGSFTQSQPAGAAAGVSVTPRANLFAYDVRTGVAVPGFTATTNAQVRGIAASPDNSRLYIVGNFTQVNGQTRNHVAALDLNGNLIAGFAPSVSGTVTSVATRGDTVYLGGSFNSVGGFARSRAAAVSSTGAVLPFAPNVADYTIRAIAVSPDSSRVLLGGSFSTVNGQQHRGVAAVNATTGASLSWAANNTVFNYGENASIFSLSTRGAVVYATAYLYKGGEFGNLEGAVAMNWSDGSIKWLEDCHGDTYSAVPFNDALYVAGHPHECRDVVGGFTGTDPVTYHRALAFSQAPTGTLLHNTVPNYFDFGGLPSPTLLSSWMPDFNVGTYTGSSQGPWSVAAGSTYVVYGGEFTKVNGARQTGLVRFLGQPEPADTSISSPAPAPTATQTPTPTPTASGPTATDPSAPVATAPSAARSVKRVALGPTAVAVRWAAPKVNPKAVTGYTVKIIKGKTTQTVRVGATKRLAVISKLKRSTVYRVVVTANAGPALSSSTKAVLVKTKRSGHNVSATRRPAKVAKPSVQVLGAHSLKVSWHKPSARTGTAVTGYEVRVYRGSTLIKTLHRSAATRRVIVKSLSSRTTYRIAVRSSNFAGWGKASAAASKKTRS